MCQMKKLLFTIFFGLTVMSIQAQVQNRNQNQNQSQNRSQNSSQNFDLFGGDSTKLAKLMEIQFDGTTSYTDYKIFDIYNDTTLVDTTLTLKKHHKFNYLRKDDFELIPFHNQGQTFNRLAYDFTTVDLFPGMGNRSKSYNYLNVDEIPFYYLPTPTSEVMYRTGLEQGQVMDALITFNTSRKFNMSLAYKGLRSLGKYRHALASHGSFRATFNYHNQLDTYSLKGHFYSFDFLNSENGGLTEESVAYFEENDPNYIDRARLDVNYTNAENMFEGKRYFVDQRLTLFSKKNKQRRIDEAIKIKRANDSIVNLLHLYKLDSISRSEAEIQAKILKANDSVSKLKIRP